MEMIIYNKKSTDRIVFEIKHFYKLTRTIANKARYKVRQILMDSEEHGTKNILCYRSFGSKDAKNLESLYALTEVIRNLGKTRSVAFSPNQMTLGGF